MLTKKSLLITGAAVTTLGVAGTVGANAAFATYDTTNDDIVTKIAQQFNLSEDEVQADFDEYKSDKEEAKVSTYLQKLVDKDKITEEQKSLIEMKLSEVRDAAKAEHDELEAWAGSEGIDTKYLFKYNLNDLVEKGEILGDQKEALQAKRDELQQKHSDARSELKQWAKDNGINVKYLKMDKGLFGQINDHGYRTDKQDK